MTVREVFCGNIAFDATQEEVATFLAEQGDFIVQDFRLSTSRDTGKSRGFGFGRLAVQGEWDEFALRIGQLVGKPLRGRVLEVSLSKREREKQARQGVALGA